MICVGVGHVRRMEMEPATQVAPKLDRPEKSDPPLRPELPPEVERDVVLPQREAHELHVLGIQWYRPGLDHEAEILLVLLPHIEGVSHELRNLHAAEDQEETHVLVARVGPCVVVLGPDVNRDLRHEEAGLIVPISVGCNNKCAAH